jgi:hypothetical protein
MSDAPAPQGESGRTKIRIRTPSNVSNAKSPTNGGSGCPTANNGSRGAVPPTPTMQRSGTSFIKRRVPMFTRQSTASASATSLDELSKRGHRPLPSSPELKLSRRGSSGARWRCGRCGRSWTNRTGRRSCASQGQVQSSRRSSPPSLKDFQMAKQGG